MPLPLPSLDDRTWDVTPYGRRTRADPSLRAELDQPERVGPGHHPGSSCSPGSPR